MSEENKKINLDDELEDYAQELKLLELIKNRQEITNHWLVEILEVLKKLSSEGYEITVPKDGIVDPPVKEIMEEVLEYTSPGIDLAPTKKGKEETKTLTKIQVESVFPLEKSYMLKDGKGYVAFIGKKLVKSATGDTVFLTEAAQHWFTEDKIQWKKEER